MKLFTKGRAEKPNGRQDALASRIAKGITARRRIVANWLNGKTDGLSAKAWLVWLSLFCSCVGAYCLYLLISAFN